MKLIVHNESSKDICIDDFNKSIMYVCDIYLEKSSSFYWAIQTLSNKEADLIYQITVQYPKRKKHKNEIYEPNINITIPKRSTFVSCVYLMAPRLCGYTKGCYKLLLMHRETKKCIATTIIEY
jgi:hypothetical protein